MSDETPEYESMGDAPTRLEALSEVDPELANEQKAVQLKVGDVVGKRFEVLGQLGFGGMGAVYRVKDIELHEERALKVMLPSLLESDNACERFLEEIKTSQKLAHVGIVRVHDLGIDGERHFRFFTMELIEGKTLHRVLQDADGSLPVEQALKITDQLCIALEYAHEHTIHRDLKPQNIMVEPNGEVKVLDFGLAKIMSTGRLTKSSMALGTAFYQAPEQSVNLQELDHRADIYSVGIILYEMLTGTIPLGMAKPPSQLNKALPKYFDQIVAKSLEVQPRDRYSSAAEFRAALNSMSSEFSMKRVAIAAIVFLTCIAGWFLLLRPSSSYRQAYADASSTRANITDEVRIYSKDEVTKGDRIWIDANEMWFKGSAAEELLVKAAREYDEAITLLPRRKEDARLAMELAKKTQIVSGFRWLILCETEPPRK